MSNEPAVPNPINFQKLTLLKMRFSFIQFSPSSFRARNSIYFAKFDELTAWWLDPIFTIMSKHLLPHARFSHSIVFMVRFSDGVCRQALKQKVLYSEWKPIQRGTFLVTRPVSCEAICKRTLQSNGWFLSSFVLLFRVHPEIVKLKVAGPSLGPFRNLTKL